MYRKHVHDVYRYSLAMLRNPSDAEDVTQTTFMNAYRAFERGEVPRQPQNWLITIAHNVCRQRFRNAARRPVEAEWDDSLAPTMPDDDDEGPSIADVQRALEHLPFNQRSALVMRELEGRSYAEIAEILKLSVSAVETLLFRARRALREQLEGALTCGEAERAISRQLDGELPREEKGRLRAHLRECKECARDARRLRAQRAALKGLGAVPLPASLVSWFGGGSAAAAGGAAAGVGLAAKAAAVVAAGAVAAGAGHQVVTASDKPTAAKAPAEPAERAAAVVTPPRAEPPSAPSPRAADAAFAARAKPTPVRARSHGAGPPAHAQAAGLDENARGRKNERAAPGLQNSVVAALVGKEAALAKRAARVKAKQPTVASKRQGPRTLDPPDRAKKAQRVVKAKAKQGKAAPAAGRRPARPRAERPTAPSAAQPERSQPEQPRAQAPKEREESPVEAPAPVAPIVEQAGETVEKLKEKLPVQPASIVPQVTQPELTTP